MSASPWTLSPFDPPDGHGLAFRHVLVADDNYASRLVIKSLLERERCAVVLAPNGKVAVDTAMMAAFDLILMDIQMPVMNGVDATRMIRDNDGPNRTVPIVAITAYSSPRLMQEFSHEGFSATLLKPFRVSQLETVWETLRHPQTKPPPPPSVVDHTPLLHTLAHVPLLDIAILSALCAAAPREAILRIVQRFWESTDGFIGTLHEALVKAADGDAQALSEFRTAVHAVKGSAANIGLLKASRLAAALQNAPPSQLVAGLSALEVCLNATRPEITAYIDGFNPRLAVTLNSGKDAQTG